MPLAFGEQKAVIFRDIQAGFWTFKPLSAQVFSEESQLPYKLKKSEGQVDQKTSPGKHLCFFFEMLTLTSFQEILIVL